MTHYVYILECADKTLYVGATNNLEKRLHQHNNLKGGAHYTKIRRPVKLLYSEEFKTLKEARSRESEIKRLKRKEKLEVINSKKINMSQNNWESLIQDRIKNFWGYGNIKGDYWFVGMEEGHDLDVDSLRGRFQDTYGKDVVDVVEGSPSFASKLKWFVSPKPPIQRTYKGYIIIRLYIELGRLPLKEEIRDFQLNRLGRKLVNGKPNDHVILELMPLPATSVKELHWLYKDLGVEDFINRKKYLEKYKPLQLIKLKRLVGKYKPRLVVFYSMSYIKDWQKIIPGTLKKVYKDQYIFKDRNTLYCVLPHPVAHGIKQDDWDNWGKEILKRVKH